MNSQQYLDHCVSVFENDKNLSAETFIIMMREYAERIMQERLSDVPQNEQLPMYKIQWNTFRKTCPTYDGVYYVGLLNSTEEPDLAKWDGVLKSWRLLKSPLMDITDLVTFWGIKTQ